MSYFGKTSLKWSKLDIFSIAMSSLIEYVTKKTLPWLKISVLVS